MKHTVVALWLLILGFIACVPALAHHGSTAYDTSTVVVLKGGTVTKFAWAGPHVIIMVDVKDSKGTVQHWTTEAGTPQTLVLAGWSKTSVKVGDTLDVYVYQSKTGNPVGRLSKIVLADGTELKDSALGYKEAP
jgi:uncharacterized protein DUF6152